HLHRLVAAAALLLGVGALLLVVQRAAGWSLPDELGLLAGLGVLALGLLAAGLLRVVYTAARQAGRSRHLGALADLVYFWPRRAHPIVPPSYALKVVPDLVDRAAEHLAEPNTRVVLAGYSHGGLLALIAAARLADTVTEEQAERIGLVTAGTPAQWGYQRAFPVLLPPERLAALYGRLEGRWRGLCRGTDPFGGGVTTWRHQVVGGKLLGIGYSLDGGISPLPPAIPGACGALVIGGDHWLPDPVARHRHVDRRWAPGVLRHTDYLVDPEWDRAVAIAAGLERPDSVAARHRNGEQPSLFTDLPRLR
ncbi:MAG: lipase family protein, partial [Thermocrispum sp.]